MCFYIGSSRPPLDDTDEMKDDILDLNLFNGRFQGINRRNRNAWQIWRTNLSDEGWRSSRKANNQERYEPKCSHVIDGRRERHVDPDEDDASLGSAVREALKGNL